jgi:hypothetical protein
MDAVSQYSHLIGINASGFYTLTIYPTNEELLFARFSDLVFHLNNYGLRSI